MFVIFGLSVLMDRVVKMHVGAGLDEELRVLRDSLKVPLPIATTLVSWPK